MIKLVKELMLEVYRGSINQNVMDNAVCNKDCPHIKEGLCPVDIEGECPVTDEETVNAFVKHKMIEKFRVNESINKLLHECGFEE